MYKKVWDGKRDSQIFFAMEKKEEGTCNNESEKKREEACFRFLLELLFDRITKDKTAVLQQKLLGYSSVIITHLFLKKKQS